LQVVFIVPEPKKVDWLVSRLPDMIDSGEVLVFANQIVRVEEVTEKIKALGHR
jgi:superfamily II DNA/RNA helicase